MLNNKQEFTVEMGGKTYIVETGRLAKQTDAAVLVSCGDSQVLVTVCCAKKVQDGQDFFPLLVDYRERFYAAGKFLGGFMKREARPSTNETLVSRLIDRPLRPLFPEGFMFETVVMAHVMSFGEDGDPEVLAGLGAAAALEISDIPFNGPLGTCKVGKIDGELVLNPNKDQWEKSTLEIVVSASENAILMLEGEGKEVTEAEMLDALDFAHDNIRKFCALLKDMRSKVGKAKREFVSAAPNETLMNQVRENFKSDVRDVLNITVKQDRSNAITALEDKVAEAITANPTAYGLTEDSDCKKEARKAVDDVLYEVMRNDILSENKRIGGRALDEVREIETEVGVLKRPHGSSLFTRGETQVLATVTIGGSEGDQMYDTIHGVGYEKFYLHYFFPPFSVCEARGVRGVGRRELGHGNLAERAIRNVLPKEGFPYTTRVMCEVLESNGSSSMGSVCSGSMALMDAGVPLTAPVAGVAMGLIKDGDNYKILTDILGDEDHLGDMDFKVAGTTKGITAIQMDIKITGITREIFQNAMSQALEGRLHILKEMEKTISNGREEFKTGVPTIATLTIPKDSIGALIGPGGKNIKKIQEDYEVNIDIEEDGTVKVLSSNKEHQKDVVNLINLQINGPEKDSVYDAVVASIKDYGAFVDIAQGVSGLVHVSELSDSRVDDVNDYVAEGDIIKVKVIDFDKFGRIKLSAKAVQPLNPKDGAKPAKKSDKGSKKED